jgi:CRP-like cAMP-binding protein
MEEAVMQAPRTIHRDSWDERLIQGVLKTTRFFHSAAPAQIAGLARQCRILEAKRGQAIASIGTRLPGAFAVVHGTVKLALRRSDNDERVVRLVQAGQSFGESTALLGRAARFEATAVTDAKLVMIPAAAVFAFVERDPRCAREFLVALAERNLDLLAELESSSTRRGAQRLAAYLDSLVQPGEGNGHCVVRLPATKTVVASRLDMKKETLSRLLRSFVERGLIEVAQREIQILDRVRLAELAAALE